jgi:hypothetical protein
MVLVVTGKSSNLPKRSLFPRHNAKKVILGHFSEMHFEKFKSVLCDQSYDVLHGRNLHEIRAHVLIHRDSVVVLGIEPDCESAFLCCAKLTAWRDELPVILTGPDEPRLARFARFCGASAYFPVDTNEEYALSERLLAQIRIACA